METTVIKTFHSRHSLFLLRQRDLLGSRQRLAEVGELLPRRGQVELSVLLRQLDRFLNNSLQFVIITILEMVYK
jgi:hypothetical protein